MNERQAKDWIVEQPLEILKPNIRPIIRIQKGLVREGRENAGDRWIKIEAQNDNEGRRQQDIAQ